jgi:hypothetical protein
MSTKQVIVPFKKSDGALQIAYGEVYLPNIPDSDDDFMSPTEIRKTAHKFLQDTNNTNISIEHDGVMVPASVVESFIVRKCDDTFIEGSWAVGVHIEDADIWAKVESGDISGFSMEGIAIKTETEIEIEIPEFIKGETFAVEDHSHTFTVQYNDEGKYLGGYTSEVEGHMHNIAKGTSTEKVNGHSHRFAIIEDFMNG